MFNILHSLYDINDIIKIHRTLVFFLSLSFHFKKYRLLTFTFFEGSMPLTLSIEAEASSVKKTGNPQAQSVSNTLRITETRLSPLLRKGKSSLSPRLLSLTLCTLTFK